jgi:anti-sigma regulatory factor (Ser/Thr protein kinase)
VRDIAQHILDLAENSLRAGASRLDITIERDTAADTLSLVLADNGRGMSPEELARVRDPFYSTKADRRTGLGIPLAAQAAQRAGGRLSIDSGPGLGTTVTAVFQDSHLDRQPMGDLAGSVAAILLASPAVDLRLSCRCGADAYEFDTAALRRQLEGAPLNAIAVLTVLRDNIRQNTERLIA